VWRGMDMRIQGFGACAALMADADNTAVGEEQRVKEHMTKRPRHVCPGRLASGRTADLS
jgi:hypothetical protein